MIPLVRLGATVALVAVGAVPIGVFFRLGTANDGRRWSSGPSTAAPWGAARVNASQLSPRPAAGPLRRLTPANGDTPRLPDGPRQPFPQPGYGADGSSVTRLSSSRPSWSTGTWRMSGGGRSISGGLRPRWSRIFLIVK